MEPDQIDMRTALQALAVISVIPVVLFALWVDYFNRYIHELSIKKPQFERDPEIQKVRFASLIVILFELTLFLGSTEIRHTYPLTTEAIFITTVLLPLWIQSRAEKHIQPSRPTDDLLAVTGKAIVAWLTGAALYILILMASIKGASSLAEVTHASTIVGVTFLLIGGILGVVVGLALNFGFGPFYLKKILPNTHLEDEQLRSRFKNCFLKSRIRSPDLRIVELDRLRISGILYTGFHNGRGIFEPVLFISRYTLSLLSSVEIETLILNQVSHLALKHLTKRFVFSLSLILLTTITALSAVVLSGTFIAKEIAFGVLGPAVALVAFLFSLRLLTKQIKFQELEADIHCIEKLGVQLEDFIRTLRKLDASAFINSIPQGASPNRMNFTNPETERRIQNLLLYFASRQKQRGSAETAKIAEYGRDKAA